MREGVIHALRQGSFAGLLCLGGGCAPNVEPLVPCCYIGDLTLARVDQLYFATDDGDRLRFAEVFEGFEPQMSFLTRPLPFREARIGLVVYQSLSAVLPQYDANRNAVIEEPELTVLYLREAALGLGHEIDYVGVNPPVGALVLPKVELGGLMRYVHRRRRDMNPEAQRIFRDLQILGRDIRTRGRGPDRLGGCKAPPC